MNNETIEATDEPPTMDPDDEAAFVRLMMRVIDEHKLRTPEFIQCHITAFDAFNARDMADFWRDALASYEQAQMMAEARLRGDRHLKIVD